MALSVQEILDLNLDKATFVDRPTLAAPVRSDFDFTRSTKGTVFGPNGEFATKSAGVPRIIGGHNALGQQGLLLEGQVDQILGSPADVSANNWSMYQTTKNGGAGTAFGKSFGEFRETTDNGQHSFNNDAFATTQGTNLYADCLVRPQGRSSIKIRISSRDSNNNSVGAPIVSFQFSDETTSIVSESNCTIYAPTVEKIPNTSWYRVGFGVGYDPGIYGYNVDFHIGQGHGSYSYTGDTSKGVDLLVANVKEGETAETSFIFGKRVRNADHPVGSISEENWNDSEGTWYIDFIQRPHYVEGFPRVLSYGNAQIWYAIDGNGEINYRCYHNTGDQIGGSITHPPGNTRVKIATSFKKENNTRGLNINGQHDEDQTGLAGNDDFMLRPSVANGNKVRFTDPGRQGSRIILEARYIPKWLSIDERNVLTA